MEHLLCARGFKYYKSIPNNNSSKKVDKKKGSQNYKF